MHISGSVHQLKNGMAQLASFSNKHVRKLEFSSCDGQEDGEHDGVSFVGIERCAMPDAFLF